VVVLKGLTLDVPAGEFGCAACVMAWLVYTRLIGCCLQHVVTHITANCTHWRYMVWRCASFQACGWRESALRILQGQTWLCSRG
jgi:hypothetical protein